MGKLAPLSDYTEMMAMIASSLVVDLDDDWLDRLKKDQAHAKFSPDDEFANCLESHINAFILDLVRVKLEVPKSNRKRTQESFKAIIRSAGKMADLLQDESGPMGNWQGIKVILPCDANDIPPQLVVILRTLEQNVCNKKVCNNARKLAGLLEKPSFEQVWHDGALVEHTMGRKVAIDYLIGMSGWGIFGDDRHAWESRDLQYKELQRLRCSPATLARHRKEFSRSDWSKTREIRLDKNQLIKVFRNLKRAAKAQLESLADSPEVEKQKVARFRAATGREDLKPFSPDMDKASGTSPEGKVYDQFAENLKLLYEYNGGKPNTGHPMGHATPFARFVKNVENVLPDEVRIKTLSLTSKARKFIRK